jgi:hypothetical protein
MNLALEIQVVNHCDGGNEGAVQGAVTLSRLRAPPPLESFPVAISSGNWCWAQHQCWYLRGPTFVPGSLTVFWSPVRHSDCW